jgi:hypothetical protein
MQDSRGNKKKVGIQDPGPLRWNRSLHPSSHHVRIKSFKVNVKSESVLSPLSLCPGACWPVSVPCTRLPGSGSGFCCMVLVLLVLMHAGCSTLLYLSLLPSRMDKTGKKGKGADGIRGRKARHSQSPVRLGGCLVAWLEADLHICISAWTHSYDLEAG